MESLKSFLELGAIAKSQDCEELFLYNAQTYSARRLLPLLATIASLAENTSDLCDLLSYIADLLKEEIHIFDRCYIYEDKNKQTFRDKKTSMSLFMLEFASECYTTTDEGLFSDLVKKVAESASVDTTELVTEPSFDLHLSHLSKKHKLLRRAYQHCVEKRLTADTCLFILGTHLLEASADETSAEILGCLPDSEAPSVNGYVDIKDIRSQKPTEYKRVREEIKRGLRADCESYKSYTPSYVEEVYMLEEILLP